MFWNLARFNAGVPLLAGLVAGAAARAAEQDSQEELVEHMLQVGCGCSGAHLRTLHVCVEGWLLVDRQ
jgi:hypothetical protein